MKKIIFMIMLLMSITVYSQQIEFIVSASPGGPNDIVTRKIAERLEHNSNIKFVIINKPGAGMRIAYNYVASTNKPTLLLSTNEIVNDDVYSQLEDIFTVGYFYNKLYVSDKSEIKNIKDLIELSKTREILFGHGGVGTSSYKAMESVCSTIRCLAVPYKSGANGMLALMTREIDAYALVSYGFVMNENSNYRAIYNINNKDKNWVKIFAKNLSEKDKETIRKILETINDSFYIDMGFIK